MTDHTPTEKLRRALFDTLGDERTGMLGLEGTRDHMQPMTHFFDPDRQVLWFISGQDTDLVRQIKGAPRTAHFTVTAGDRSLYACISGLITQTNDREKLEEVWSPMAAMWFDGGIDDPNVALLCMPLDEAAVWTVEAGALRFGLEMVRGAAGDHDPEVGDHGVLEFRHTA
ncbi:pyridoxamine 5'-phosphate oxidase family protein [Maritalea mobilis]|uniref:pyridoxamine 5'-phosphate oxidase family protein n=1 Tax=Maritalea mobilis TaxID=483324 RepID=UPI001C97AA7C|nr:pyridoxamine 5'-phosphate oxidase family protein [Maritalea mobilis]MBY6201121.1 pyridoxamine 5'-phosphate oxidase family protein [Maritalea mobilis]